MGLLAPPLVAAMSLIMAGCGAVSTPIPTPVATSYRAVSFTTQDGVELKGRLFGQGETGVVLAHMFPTDESSWWGFAQILADRGYVALTFNFRGYGEGDDKSGGSKEIELIHRDVEAALDFIGDQGASMVFLAGASMGGTASLKVAVRRQVAGVVSLSAPAEFKGLTVEGEQVGVPVLLIAARGDRGAKNSLESMIEDGTVGDETERVIYDKGADHGTDILTGENGDAARERILSFLKANGT